MFISFYFTGSIGSSGGKVVLKNTSFLVGNAAPLCLTWIIWREIKNCMLSGVGLFIIELKPVFWKTQLFLFGMPPPTSKIYFVDLLIPFLFYFSSLGGLGMHIRCTWGLPFIVIRFLLLTQKQINKSLPQVSEGDIMLGLSVFPIIILLSVDGLFLKLVFVESLGFSSWSYLPCLNYVSGIHFFQWIIMTFLVFSSK